VAADLKAGIAQAKTQETGIPAPVPKAMSSVDQIGPTIPRDANLLNFESALKKLKNRKAMARRGWNGRGMYVMLQLPDEGSKMALPYIAIKTADNKTVPWVASHTDLLSDDWTEA